MAGPEAQRSSTLGRSGRQERNSMAHRDGGGSGEAHQWRNSAEELVNRVDDEVMQQRLEVCVR
jgi:hypothetical protein